MEADNASLILNNYHLFLHNFLREEIDLSFGQIISRFVLYFTQFCAHCDQKARTVPSILITFWAGLHIDKP